MKPRKISREQFTALRKVEKLIERHNLLPSHSVNFLIDKYKRQRL